MDVPRQPLYVVISKYRYPFSALKPFLPAHQAFLATCYEEGGFIASGQEASESGGVFVVHAPDRAGLEDRLRKDPFVSEGLVDYEIVEFRVSRVCDQLGPLFAGKG